jgi:hypothetical protein
MAVQYSLVCDDHKPQNLCACGDNSYCPNCGQGQGSIPCRCSTHKHGWKVDLHQRLNLIARLCLMCPDQSRAAANAALNELFDDGHSIGLIERFCLPRRTLAAIAGLRPNACADLLGDLLDEMGVPE